MMVGVAVAAAVLLVWPPSSYARLARLGPSESKSPSRVQPADLMLVLLPVLGFVVGRLPGTVLGLVLVPGARGWLQRLERAGDRLRREKCAGQVPVVLDLLAAVIAVGRSPQEAFALVSEHSDEPIASELADVATRLTWSSDPQGVWRGLDGTVLASTGRAFARSADSGSGVVSVLMAAADEARRDRAGERRRAASRIAVSTAGPLGACFLPAFILIGIVPTLLGAAKALWG